MGTVGQYKVISGKGRGVGCNSQDLSMYVSDAAAADIVSESQFTSGIKAPKLKSHAIMVWNASVSGPDYIFL